MADVVPLKLVDGGGGVGTLAEFAAGDQVPAAQLLHAVPQDSASGAAQVPTGTTAQRPANGAGKLRFNTDLARPEVNDGAKWGSLGGATGGGNDAVFYLADQVINNDFTIPTGQNAMTPGPVTIATGKTVTVSTGSTWSIV
ncbi:MAG: hypothetical protein ACOH2R_08620 [Pseudomonas sp.]